MPTSFGGPHSPNGGTSSSPPEDNAFAGRKARQVSPAARFMYLLPVPLLFAGLGEIFQGDVSGMVLELGGFALMMLSAWLLNEGLRAEEHFNARKIAKPPTIPRKLFAAVSIGLGVAAASFSGMDGGVIGSAVMGTFAAGSQLLAFGSDPMKAKGASGVDQFEADRVATAVDKAEALLRETLDAAKGINDRGLEARIERLASKARDLFRRVEDDPRDLPRARRFMTVYLMGARDATAKFAEIYGRNRSQDVRIKYEALLSDLEVSFTNHRDELLLEDRSGLDVEIEVLRERLQREGVLTRS